MFENPQQLLVTRRPRPFFLRKKNLTNTLLSNILKKKHSSGRRSKPSISKLAPSSPLPVSINKKLSSSVPLQNPTPHQWHHTTTFSSDSSPRCRHPVIGQNPFTPPSSHHGSRTLLRHRQKGQGSGRVLVFLLFFSSSAFPFPDFWGFAWVGCSDIFVCDLWRSYTVFLMFLFVGFADLLTGGFNTGQQLVLITHCSNGTVSITSIFSLSSVSRATLGVVLRGRGLRWWKDDQYVMGW